MNTERVSAMCLKDFFRECPPDCFMYQRTIQTLKETAKLRGYSLEDAKKILRSEMMANPTVYQKDKHLVDKLINVIESFEGVNICRNGL